jgi:hypothetical protein
LEQAHLKDVELSYVNEQWYTTAIGLEYLQ